MAAVAAGQPHQFTQRIDPGADQFHDLPCRRPVFQRSDEDMHHVLDIDRLEPGVGAAQRHHRQELL
jgi:hypothetical protein